MRITAVFPLLLLATAAASQPQPRPQMPQPTVAQAPQKPLCDRFAGMDRADGPIQRGRIPRAERLDRLPSGDLHLTVERTIGGCHVPVIVRQDIGGAR